ncbi:MAG: lysophospholipase [Pseudohongiellaceae bacterium]|jgi:lysophospholipase
MNLEQVLQHLPDFSFDDNQSYAPPIAEYFKYYGLDFENQMGDLHHNFGLVDAGGYQVACHYFSLDKGSEQAGKQSKGCILIVHGFYDHTGLYNHLIKNCLQQGFDVLAFDLPGHGLSSGQRASIASFDEYQVVLKQITAYFSSHANIVAMIGQSTGAAIVMHYLFDYPNAEVKAILLAPLLKTCGWGTTVLLFQLLNPFIKWVPRRFANNSQNKAFLRFLKHDDPLQYRYTPLEWVGALIEWVNSFKYFKANKSDVLIVQGTDDNTVDWVHNLPVIQKKLPRANVEYIEGAGHHLVKELDALRERTFSCINEYLKTI